MKNIVKRGCGLDVHQKIIVACIIRQGVKKQIKEFGTTTKEIKKLSSWLKEHKITHVAMESTGVYWKPIFNILEDNFEIILVNARHIKNVPGRKTDVKDAQWICQLLQAGLLKGSFIPPEEIRQLRNFTRHLKQVQRTCNSEKNRVHKLLQDANIKLTSVVSNIFGAKAKLILKDLSNGITNPKKLASHMESNKKLSAKREQAEEALEGRFTPHHQHLLKILLNHIDFLEDQMKELEHKIDEIVNKNHQEEHELLQTIPGISKRSANTIISEIGTDMSVFPDHKHLSSWAGLCPGNNESAGKKKTLG